MGTPFKSDEEIIKAIQGGAKKRRDALAQIYMNKNLNKRITNFLIHKKADPKQKDEILAEAILIFDRNIRNNKFKQESNIYTYLFSIATYYWINYKKTDLHPQKASDYELLNIKDVQNPELIVIQRELKEQLWQILNLMGEKCKKILEYWCGKYSYSEIAKYMDLSSESSARKMKYNCKKKLVELVKTKPDLIPAEYHGRIVK